MKSIKLFFALCATAGIVSITSCSDDEEPPLPPAIVENTAALCNDGIDNDGDGDIDCDDSDCTVFIFCETPIETLTGNIGTKTLDASTVYIIDRFAFVDDGDVLTIPAGTIFKAEDGQGADASALIVARGGKIDAQGTASQPIIFTSVNDNIEPGETASSLSASADGGKWGGLIILGKAPVSVNPGDAADGIGREGFIEGVPSSFSFSKYGGDDEMDDSGILNYVSIRFTGSTLSTDEEIQGLTLGGVGAGTTISNIEIVSSNDDGVEFFGGTVDVTNILIAYQTDDAIDIDQSYKGTVDNGLILLYNPAPGNDGMEIDGPEAVGVNDTGFFTITNTTVYQKNTANIARLKSNAQGVIMNFAARDFAGETILFAGAKDVTIMDSEFNQAEATVFTQTDVDTFTNTNNSFSVTSFSNGADESKFDWTWSKSIGLF